MIKLVLVDPETNEIQNLIVPEEIVSVLGSSDFRVTHYCLSQDGSLLLIRLGYTAEGEKKSGYWIKDFADNKIVAAKLIPSEVPVLNPAFSPDNRKLAFVSGRDIWVYDIKKGKLTRATFSSDQQIINGDCNEWQFTSVLNTRGFKWSPDSRRIAFISFDVSGVKEFKMINYTDFLYPEIISFQHVKPGEKIPVTRIGIVNCDGSDPIWTDTKHLTGDRYITWFGWNEFSGDLYIQYLNRKQNELAIVSESDHGGKDNLVWHDSDPTFLLPFDLTWVNNNRSFIAVSERDGWRHLYKVDLAGANIKCITPGDYDIESISGYDAQNDILYFNGSINSAIHRYLYAISTDGAGVLRRITPEGLVGVNSYIVSPCSRWAFHVFSAMNNPPVTTLVSLPSHNTIKVLEDNSELRSKLAGVKISDPEFIKIDIGEGVVLDSWLIKPGDFDPSMKYPVIFNVYSMPAGQFVQDKWMNNNYLWYQYMAQHGFVIMNIDSRGTPSLYGREWRKIIYKKHGILPSDDHARAVKEIIKKYSFIDSDRVGIFGWSGGGLMSLLQILRYPDLYNVAIPGAYLSDHRLYEAGFTERFLGLPSENSEAYDLTSALTYVGQLKGDLLLVHGTGDDNVHYQSTEMLINKLVKEKKRFFVIPYPNINHNVETDSLTWYHLYDMYSWFFSTQLSKDGKRMNSNDIDN